MVILNTEGMRVCARYCNKSLFPDLESERAFERDLLKKVSATVTSHDGKSMQEIAGFDHFFLCSEKSTTFTFSLEMIVEEIFELDNHLVVYKWYDNVVMFLTGSTSENELVLADILRTYEEGLSIILRTMLEEKTLLDNLETVLLAMDELIDQEGSRLSTLSGHLFQPYFLLTMRILQSTPRRDHSGNRPAAARCQGLQWWSITRRRHAPWRTNLHSSIPERKRPIDTLNTELKGEMTGTDSNHKK
mmetsp:Transcript_36381/g.145387  ORF Transcript_36381/g.145387 Transcript_36381/m.145387 type:complete len:246 (-) Transcript_36381:627-1364(-)